MAKEGHKDETRLRSNVSDTEHQRVLRSFSASQVWKSPGWSKPVIENQV